jgi:hypothetical protein
MLSLNGFDEAAKAIIHACEQAAGCVSIRCGNRHGCVQTPETRLKRSASANDPEQDHHDGNDQKHMDEAPYGIGTHQSQQPQDDQDNSNGIKHDISSLW